VTKTSTMPLHSQSDNMVVRYIKMVKEHLQKVVALHQTDWDARLPTFLLAYTAPTHNTAGLTPVSLVLGQNSDCPKNCCLGHPTLTRNEPQLIMWQILWTIYTTSTIMAANT
jgi:hypothetical protein